MNALVRTLAAAALLAAALPATAFIRETTAVGSPKEGVCLWWGSRTVTYQVNATAVTHTACANAATAEADVALGFDAWGAASTCTDFRFQRGAALPAKTDVRADNVNLVVFRSGKCGPGQTPAANNCWDSANYGATTIAITTTHFDRATGQITDADLELFAWDGSSPSISNGHYFSCGGPWPAACNWSGTTCNDTDVQAVVAHEAGHMLGLDHPCEYSELRNPPQYPVCSSGNYDVIMNPLVGEASQRGLKQDDINGVCAVYPKGAATATCGTAPAAKRSSGGCGSGGSAGLLGLAVAVLALGRLRRRR